MDFFDIYGFSVDAEYKNKYRKHSHCCGKIEDARRAALMRRIKHLAEVLKRLIGQLSTAKTPTEKNSLLHRIEGIKAEIAMLEREMNT